MLYGGGKCGICGSPDTVKATCPDNPEAKKPNYGKHPMAKSKQTESAKQQKPAVSQAKQQKPDASQAKQEQPSRPRTTRTSASEDVPYGSLLGKYYPEVKKTVELLHDLLLAKPCDAKDLKGILKYLESMFSKYHYSFDWDMSIFGKVAWEKDGITIDTPFTKGEEFILTPVIDYLNEDFNRQIQMKSGLSLHVDSFVSDRSVFMVIILGIDEDPAEKWIEYYSAFEYGDVSSASDSDDGYTDSSVGEEDG